MIEHKHWSKEYVTSIDGQPQCGGWICNRCGSSVQVNLISAQVEIRCELPDSPWPEYVLASGINLDCDQALIRKILDE